MLIPAWGIKQAIWGKDQPEVFYFRSKEERDEYFSKADYCDKLKKRSVNPSEVQLFDTAEEALRKVF